jgi:hypothetical protein
MKEKNSDSPLQRDSVLVILSGARLSEAKP